jgi:tetratricopeptide (TPR) repeat protein
MPRLLKAAWIGAGLALLMGVTGALAQGGAGAAGGMRGTMGGARMGSSDVERLRRSLPQYEAGAEYANAVGALKASRFKEAARLAEHLTEGVPSNPEGWRLLGTAYAGDNNWKGSRRAYARAVRLVPADANAHAGLALALANLGDAKARGELDWLRARVLACAGTCPDAEHLRRYTATVEGAMAAPTGRAASPG